jgi:hypothetical protein
MPAQFSADLNPKQTGMSLGDIMKAGMYGAEMDVLNRQAQVAREKEKELPIVQGFMSSPDNKDANGNWDLDKVNTILPTIAPITGPDFAQKITQGVKNHTEATEAKMKLSNTARGYMASLYGSYAQSGTQDPKEVAMGMANLAERMPELKPYIEPALRSLQNVPPGPKFTEGLYKARDEFMTPVEQITAFGPKAKMANIGGADRVVVEQPSIRGAQPTITPTGFGGQPIGGGTNAPTGGTTMPNATTGGKMPELVKYGNLKYTDDPSLFNLNDAQKKAYEAGDKMVQAIPYSLKAAKDIQQPIRKVEEFINSASGSKLYQTLQASGKYAFGNSDLDSLIKNIAQVQAQNAKIMGLDKTDSMQDLNAKLSGSEKIETKSLAGVMQQVKADSVGAEKFINGQKKFVEKNGDINGRIMAEKFQQAWAENYDTRIFQRQNIENSQLPEREKDKRIRELDASMTKDEFDELEGKAKILHRLEKGLYK